MHIPFQAFAEAQEALRNGSADAVYLFGENGEGVSCPDRESGFFETIVQKQSTRAVFVGHDHLNNMAVKYKGVDLVYSKSIDYYAYPGIADKTEQRGATLITFRMVLTGWSRWIIRRANKFLPGNAFSDAKDRIGFPVWARRDFYEGYVKKGSGHAVSGTPLFL